RSMRGGTGAALCVTRVIVAQPSAVRRRSPGARASAGRSPSCVARTPPPAIQTVGPTAPGMTVRLRPAVAGGELCLGLGAIVLRDSVHRYSPTFLAQTERWRQERPVKEHRSTTDTPPLDFLSGYR